MAIFPTGSRIFTKADDPNLNPPDVSFDEDKRVFIGGTPMQTIVVHKSASTKINIDPNFLAHLRLGHFSVNYVNAAQSFGYKFGLAVSRVSAPFFCMSCLTEKTSCPQHGSLGGRSVIGTK